MTKRRTPSDEEQRKVQRYWNFFISAVAPAKAVEDIGAEALTRWEFAGVLRD